MRRPAAKHHDADRCEQVRHVLHAASIVGVPIDRKSLDGLDPRDLEVVADAADPVVNVADDFDHLAAKYGEDSVRGTLREAADKWQRVIEAACTCTEERRARGARRVATRITEDQLGRWRISRRPTTRLGQLLARPRARRSSPRRRRGSRRATGSGDRAGPGDPDSDDPPGDVEAPPAGGQLAEPVLTGGGA